MIFNGITSEKLRMIAVDLDEYYYYIHGSDTEDWPEWHYNIISDLNHWADDIDDWSKLPKPSVPSETGSASGTFKIVDPYTIGKNK